MTAIASVHRRLVFVAPACIRLYRIGDNPTIRETVNVAE
jgi:hypothetical protein